MTITAAIFDSFPDMGRKNAEVQLREAIDRLWDRSIILKNDEKREEFPLDQYRAQYVKVRPRTGNLFDGNALSDATEGAIRALL